MTIEEKKKIVHKKVLEKLKKSKIGIISAPSTHYHEEEILPDGTILNPGFDTTYFVKFLNRSKLHVVVTDVETLEIMYVLVSMAQKVSPEQYFSEK